MNGEREARGRYQQLIDGLTDVVCARGPAGHCHHATTVTSPARSAM